MENIEVLIPVYNGELYLRDQINSILLCGSQEYKLSIIVFDDLSYDNSVAILNSYTAKNITYEVNRKNIGLKNNITKLIRSCEAKCFFLSDQDDVWFISKVKVHLQAHGYDEDKLVISDCEVTDEALSVQHASYLTYRKSSTSIISNWVKFGLLGSCYSVSLRDKTDLLWCLEHGKSPHDVIIFLYFKLARKPVHLLVNDSLMYYRRHENALSNHMSFSFKRLFSALQNRFFYIFDVVIIWSWIQKRKFFN